MKPLVSPMKAWTCTVISGFAICILGFLGVYFNNNHHELVGSTEDPTDGPAVAQTISAAVIVYFCFFVFCLSQGYWHNRRAQRGVITLQ
jgi:ribonuclease kappa